MSQERATGRRKLALPLGLLLVVCLAASGCQLSSVVGLFLPASTLAPGATPSQMPAPTAAGPAFVLETPSTCPSVDEAVRLTDSSSGFEVLLPSNWRNLRPGDAGWVDEYGSYGSDIENEVADGTIQDFAVPLAPMEADPQVNLAVYVEANDIGESLEELADGYASMLAQMGYTDVGTAWVTLRAGDFARVTGTRPLDHAGRRGAVFDYVVLGQSRAYFLVFISGFDAKDRYAAVFSCIADSFHFIAPAATPVPMPS